MRSAWAGLAVLLAVCGGLGAAGAEPTNWIAELSADDAQVTVHDAVGVQGGAIVVGTQDRDGDGTAGWIARLAHDGTVLWTRVFDARSAALGAGIGFPEIESFAFRGVTQAADGSLWIVGDAVVGGETAGRYGFVLAARADGRLTNFYVHGDGAEALHAVTTGSDGLIAVGETLADGMSRGWIVGLAPGQGVVLDTAFRPDLTGRLTDATIVEDGRLVMVMTGEGASETQPLHLFVLPPDPDRPMNWGTPQSATGQTAPGAPDSFVVALDDGHIMLFSPAERDADGFTSGVTVYGPDGAHVGHGIFADGGQRVEILSAATDVDRAVAVGSARHADQAPSLWIGTIGPNPAEGARRHVIDAAPALSAGAATDGAGGLLLAAGHADGAVRTVALGGPLPESLGPAGQIVDLGPVAAFHALCAPDLCDQTLRLPRYADRMGQVGMPFDRSLRDQFARVEGIDVTEDGVILAAGLDGGQSTRHRVPWVRAFASDGSQMWSTALPEWNGAKPFVRDVVALNGGRIVAAGYASDRVEVDGDRTRAFVAPVWVLDGDGTVVETVELDIAPVPRGQFEDFGLHAAMGLGDMAIVAGGVGGPSVGADFEHGRGVLAAVDGEGTVVWRTHLPQGDGYDRTVVLTDAAAAPDGTIVAVGTGMAESGGASAFGYVAVVDADGMLVWESPVDLLAGASARLNAVTVGPDGTIYLAGDGTYGCPEASGTDVFRQWVAALTVDRSIGWMRCLIDHDVVGIGGLAVSDGRVVVAGYADAPALSGLGSDPVGWVGAVDPADGTVLADDVMGAGIEFERLLDSTIGPEGQVWVAGRVSTFRGVEGWIARLAPGALVP